MMVATLTPLIFALGAVLAAIALLVTAARYRRIALANIAALRTVNTIRDFEIRIGRHPALVGSPAVIAWPRRPALPRRSTAAAGLRAAA